jgi:4'-phosphopantetheinyl transferase
MKEAGASMAIVHHAAPPVHPELAGGEVHVWQASLDLREPRLNQIRRFVSGDERERADRFRFPRDRDRFLAARGILRLLLARYLRGDPERVKFRYGRSGKPELPESSRTPTLHFNISHSRGLGLFAFAHARRVGIDLEALRPVPEAEQIAERFFSPRERSALLALPRTARLESFLRLWTCKEAFLKASGEGLSRPLHEVEVELSGDRPARLVLGEDPPVASPWILQEISPSSGFVAALVAERADEPRPHESRQAPGHPRGHVEALRDIDLQVLQLRVD